MLQDDYSLSSVLFSEHASFKVSCCFSLCKVRDLLDVTTVETGVWVVSLDIWIFIFVLGLEDCSAVCESVNVFASVCG